MSRKSEKKRGPKRIYMTASNYNGDLPGNWFKSKNAADEWARGYDLHVETYERVDPKPAGASDRNIAQACRDWVTDTNDCHFCDYATTGEHAEECLLCVKPRAKRRGT